MSDRLSLTALQLLIRDSIVLAMPGSYWVTAEIAELKENYAGHCYLELVEKDQKTDNVKTRIRATIWSARYRMLKPRFEMATGTLFAAGMKVLLKVTVDYHELYGLSLNISDVDPAYTMGEMAIRRNEIIKRLKEEGVLGMNQEMEFPILPQRIAVISSASSAGYTDFCNQLAGNPYGYRFASELFNSPMQGEETEQGIVRALDQISGRLDEFDLVAILRGGGSTTDLQWFDNYSIAFHITQFPLPVITGIGHEKDISVTDMVAWKSLKTPTAAASFLIESMNETDTILKDKDGALRSLAKELLREYSSMTSEYARRIIPSASGIVSQLRREIASVAMKLSGGTSGYIRNAGIRIAVSISELRKNSRYLSNETAARLIREATELKSGSLRLIARNREDINARDIQIKLADPVNILKKGFTITEMKGMTVRNSEQLEIGDVITTRFHDGIVESSVTVNQKENKQYDKERDEIQ
ncbi:MAG: exodeoxyribonuclease VII large subunit [Bacteroidales bacterium]